MPEGRGKGRPFQKGHKFGKGQPPAPPEVRAIANMTKKEALAKLSQFLSMQTEQVLRILADPTSPAMDAVLCSAINQAILGNPKHLDIMLDRLYGKVMAEVSIKAPKPILIEYLNGDKVLLGQDKPDE